MIFQMYYFEGYPFKDIGFEFGVTESRVSQWISAIDQKLKRLNEGIGILSDLLRSVSSDEARRAVRSIFIKGIK